MPLVNPDGREKAIEKDCTSKIGQNNANGKDLDSDFISKEFRVSFICYLHVIFSTVLLLAINEDESFKKINVSFDFPEFWLE